MDDEPAPTAAPTEPPLAGLLGVLREEPGLLGALGRRSTVLVLPDAVRAAALAGLTALSRRRPIVVAVPNVAEAERLAGDLTAFLPQDAVELFPSWETLPFERVSPSIETMGRRLRVMGRLRSGDDTLQVVVAPARALAQRLGAEVTVNGRTADVIAEVQKATGGVHGVLVTAVHPQAFGQAIGLTRRGGTIVFNGLPPGDFPAPIFDIVLKGLTIRGSIVGTRQDMVEALDFYARGLIHPTVQTAALDDINEVFGRMERGEIDGRVVIDYR